MENTAASAALSGSRPSAPQTTSVVEAVAPAVLVDCQVTGASLTDCKAVDADGTKAAAAFALANPGRILIMMTVNP